MDGALAALGTTCRSRPWSLGVAAPHLNTSLPHTVPTKSPDVMLRLVLGAGPPPPYPYSHPRFSLCVEVHLCICPAPSTLIPSHLVGAAEGGEFRWPSLASVTQSRPFPASFLLQMDPHSNGVLGPDPLSTRKSGVSRTLSLPNDSYMYHDSGNADGYPALRSWALPKAQSGTRVGEQAGDPLFS